MFASCEANIDLKHTPNALYSLHAIDLLLLLSLYSRSADDSLDTIAVPRAVIRYNGTVTALLPRILKSTCAINVKDFPFDKQVGFSVYYFFCMKKGYPDIGLCLSLIGETAGVQEKFSWRIEETVIFM